MFCKYCGKEILDTAIFCNRCGKKIRSDLDQSSTKSYEYKVDKAEDNDRKDVDYQNQEADDSQDGHSSKQGLEHSIYRTQKKRKYEILVVIICLLITGVCFGFISHQVLAIKEKKYGIAQFGVVDVRDLFTIEGFERYCKKNSIDMTVEKKWGDYSAQSRSVFYVKGEKVCLPLAYDIFFGEYIDDFKKESKETVGDRYEELTKRLKRNHHYGVYSFFAGIEFEKPMAIPSDYDSFPEADLETLRFIKAFEEEGRDVVYTTYQVRSEDFYEDDDYEDDDYEDGFAAHVAYIHIPYPKFEAKNIYKTQNGVLENHEGDLVKEENFEAGAVLMIYTAIGRVDSSTYATRCSIQNYWRDLSCEIEYNKNDRIYGKNLRGEVDWEWLLYDYSD